MRIEYYGGVLSAYLEGELDHHSSMRIRAEVDTLIEEKKPIRLVLDFSGVTFMDSSGIGLVIGRFKVMKDYGGVEIVGASKHIAKIMNLSGLSKLAIIKE